MKKRLLMVMIAAVMALGLVACDSPSDSKEKTKISRESDDEDEDDDEDDDDKDSKKNKKDKKKDNDKKKDKDKDKKDKDNDDDDTIDNGSNQNQSDYWTVDDSVVGSDFTVDDEYISTNHYNASTGEMEVCDYDDNNIVTLYVPEGYVVTFASEKGGAFDLNNENQYFDSISIDYRERLFISDYIKNGKEPGGDIDNYVVTYDEYEIDGVTFIIAHEEYYDTSWKDDYDYDYILIPYESDNETEYVSICFVYNKTSTEIKQIAMEMLGLN